MTPPDLRLRSAMAPLLVDTRSSAVVTDFDGTLSPIVADPTSARPLEGSLEVLGALAHRFGVVAVVSGRPVGFLRERVPVPGVQLVGLYGLEWLADDGTIAYEPGAERWRPVIADVVDRVRSEVADGVRVESKDLTTTVHWRQHPAVEAEVVGVLEAEAARTGLRAYRGRMSLELRPPLAVDKGSVVRRLVGGCSAACFLGDDVGDIPAFSALSEIGASGGMATVSVVVADEETSPEVARVADVIVDGPVQALALLRWLSEQAPGNG